MSHPLNLSGGRASALPEGACRGCGAPLPLAVQELDRWAGEYCDPCWADAVRVREIGRCTDGWIAEEVLHEDAVVYVFRRGARNTTPLQTIRCTTWERAREWVDTMQEQGYRTQIRWEPINQGSGIGTYASRPGGEEAAR